MPPIRPALPAGIAALLLAACDGFPASTDLDPNAGLPLLRGYRGVEDSCALTGESDFTRNFLDDAADLVSCPIGSAAEETLTMLPNVRQVAVTEAYALYTVPRR